MKTIKFEHKLAEAVLSGSRRSTWRLHDDQNLSVNDRVVVIDKLNPSDEHTWQEIGIATLTSIIEKRLNDITQDELQEHGFTSKEQVLLVFQQYYGQEVNWQTPVKMISFDFSPGLQDLPKPTEQTYEKVIMYSDGGSRGNPGPSACAYVITDEQNNVIVSHGTYIGITTNNQAEYTGLKLGLEEARKLGAHEVQVYMDSLLVVNQMRGQFKVKNRDLWPIHDSLLKLTKEFKHISFTQVPREFNKQADRLVNQALDEHLKELENA